nr:restriction endonuclease PLD domain-containing protein [Brevibacterium jeotgali]
MGRGISVLIEDLASAILTPPQGASHLDVVTGYLSVSAALWCLHQGHVPSSLPQGSKRSTPGISVRAIAGMATAGGVSRGQHESFLAWSARLGGQLDIRYPSRSAQRPIHSKVYVWRDLAGQPISAFSGSANFTNPGLGIGGNTQENVLHSVDPTTAGEYVDIRTATSIDCNDPEVDEYISFPETADSNWAAEYEKADPASFTESHEFYLYSRMRKQSYADGAGVNWGRRKSRASQDEAYVAIPADIGRSDFFPPKNTPFTVMWDDGTSMVMRGASGSEPSGKDLTTLPSNSEFGRYLRKRLRVSPGARIDIEALIRYGRTHITAKKNPNGEYFFDFHPLSSSVDEEAQRILETRDESS